MLRLHVAALALVVVALTLPDSSGGAAPVYRIARVADGDTVTLGNGQRVRLVQIDM
jgi:endonuclease YncB( thermonuclease family)